MEQLVRFLFGHERAVFRNGQFGFDVRPSALTLVLIVLLIGAFIYFIYIRKRGRLPKSTTAALVAMRAALLAFMILLLFRPVVVVSSAIPRSSYVAVLIDDSLSMKLKDMPAGATRLDAAKQALLVPQCAGKNSFLNQLSDKFKTTLYGFSGTLATVRSGDELDGEGHSSDPGGALAETLKRSTGTPLSAIVIATDGAANVPGDLGATLRELRARDVPVFAIGVGNTTRPMDAELMRISLPRRVLLGSKINIEAVASLSNYGASKVLLGVREDGRAVKTEEFNMRGNDSEVLSLEVTPATAGTHRYTVEITPLDG